MATKKPRYMISVTDEMFEQIEDFRFKNRFQTRSDTTTAILQIGLDVINMLQNEQNLGSVCNDKIEKFLKCVRAKYMKE